MFITLRREFIPKAVLFIPATTTTKNQRPRAQPASDDGSDIGPRPRHTKALQSSPTELTTNLEVTVAPLAPDTVASPSAPPQADEDTGAAEKASHINEDLAASANRDTG